MPCSKNEELDVLVNEARQVIPEGKIADYIPALKMANPNELSAAIFYPDGNCISAGDVGQKLTLQSISKVLALAFALMDCGEETVFSKIGCEPTGDPFNSIVKLETGRTAKPPNPMINAGALAVTSLIKGQSVDERFERLLAFIRKLAADKELSYNEEVARSEFETAHLNRSLCYFMKQGGVIHGDVEELLDLYTKQCAIQMDCLDLARIGLVFAFNGKDPVDGRQIIPSGVARLCKTFMVTCGMYNASGEFAIKVGIPAKSGVSGGIMGAVPNRFGIGILGPALDETGNSIGGMKLLEMMSDRYGLSIF